VPFSPHNLYVQGLIDFLAATEGKGQPAATGWDCVASLAVALAVREAARTGQRQTIDYGRAA
jgi:1,5-anhydro-D-fructose reductase (1,5-anhydro-D-mannitol-forming)